LGASNAAASTAVTVQIAAGLAVSAEFIDTATQLSALESMFEEELPIRMSVRAAMTPRPDH